MSKRQHPIGHNQSKKSVCGGGDGLTIKVAVSTVHHP